ncbi:MAG TPA: flavodoxin domain-containing protein, partial [Kofleriaceae bacterium]
MCRFVAPGAGKLRSFPTTLRHFQTRGTGPASCKAPGRRTIMRVLVTWGSRGGGTEGVAAQVAAALLDAGIEVELRAAREVDTFAEYRAAIIGGAVSANHWHRDARRFVTRHLDRLRRVPVWMFSSAVDSDPACRATVAAVPQVAVLMERVGAQGHSRAWRNPAQIRAWAIDIAARLSTARPVAPVEPPGRAL